MGALMLLWRQWDFEFGLAAEAAEDTCPAGGCGKPKELKCAKWRQTGGCSPSGPREQHGDKNCNEEIGPGTSGFCQCGTGGDKVLVRKVTCDHRPFRCATECLQYERYLCVGWRQTGGCSADGDREPANDKSCSTKIDAGSSGYCECGADRVVKKPGCEAAEYYDAFTCADVCAAESDFYEELGLDMFASEKAIKQAFRKMSLKYHPDKTRNDPVLTARFAAIREAYDVIGNAEQRGIYDAIGLKALLESKQNKVEKGQSMEAELPVDLASMYNGVDIETSIKRKVVCRGCEGVSNKRCNQCVAKCANEIEIRNVRMGPMVMQQQVEVPSKQKCKMLPVKLPIHVEPGMADGDVITFPGMGEQQPKMLPGDVQLKLKMEEHPFFKRVGMHLHASVHMSLKEAILGWNFTLALLDGRSLDLSFNGITSPYAIIKIEGEGMPMKGDPTTRGDLFVKVSVQVPTTKLTEPQRAWLGANFPEQ